MNEIGEIQSPDIRRVKHKPFASEMLSDNSYESFQASQDSTMYNNGSRGWLIRVISLLSRTIFQVEPLRQLEVELYCGTLE